MQSRAPFDYYSPFSCIILLYPNIIPGAHSHTCLANLHPFAPHSRICGPGTQFHSKSHACPAFSFSLTLHSDIFLVAHHNLDHFFAPLSSWHTFVPHEITLFCWIPLSIIIFIHPLDYSLTRSSVPKRWYACPPGVRAGLFRGT